MIRKATHTDLDAIMKIVRSAQSALAELGIDQWQDGYPQREIISSDIDANIGYILCDEHNVPIGYIAIVLNGEPAYSQIAPSSWHTPDNYVVVHRLCISESARRKGMALLLMRHAAHIAQCADIYAMRIDTHEGNTRMLNLLTKLGFEYCGKIIYEQSGERVAYDINLNSDNTL